MKTSYREAGAVPQIHRNISGEINPVRALVHSQGFGLAILALVHPVLALAMRTSALVATAHALLTLAVGLSLALFSQDTRKVGYVAAYVAGAEVLWRMTNARIFWEGGKYFTIFILAIALLRIKPWQRSGSPLLYFLLLCASIPFTILNLGFSGIAREAISFNLSGPFALMICALYFSQMTFDRDLMRRLVVWMLFPILGMATLTLYGTLFAGPIVFTDQSNFATSGGFGPNQVSAILGLGGGMTLILFLMERNRLRGWVSLVLAVGLLSLSAMTFSRGGVYNAGLMLALALAHYLRGARGRAATLIVLLVIGVVGSYLIFPRLNAFTGGMLDQRFANLDPTLRSKIARADLDLWFANPALGVGPGVSKTDRIALLGFSLAAHTEYTRVLAEHGTAGLLALFVLLSMAIRTYRRAPNIEAKIWVVALLAWPLLEMSHAAMRVAAISFLYGLAMVNWKDEPGESPLAQSQGMGH